MQKLPLVLTFLLAALAGAAFAQTPSVNKLRLTVTATKERVSKDKKETASLEESSEKWVYAVIVKNTSFSDLENLRLEYRAFKKDDFHGAKSEKMERREGVIEIEKLPKHGEYPFLTKEFIIQKSELKGGWEYTDGSKSKIKDSLYGIWIRIYQKDDLVFELILPSGLKSEKW